ncbi:MAG: tyrosinase family protein [Polyangiaceae bacterium]
MPRKRHDQMTADEWSDLLEAFEGLHALDTPFPRHVDFLDVHVRAFEDRCGPGGRPHFLAWHRHLLHRFERALQELRRSVCIPYWDVYTDPAIPAALDDPRRLERWRVTRHFRLHEMPTREEIDVVRAQKRFVSFERMIEALIHEPVLAATGGLDARGYPGTIASATATLDPLFWCHLANIDRLWVEFQTRLPAEVPRNARETLEPGPLFGVQVQAVLSISALGYGYV